VLVPISVNSWPTSTEEEDASSSGLTSDDWSLRTSFMIFFILSFGLFVCLFAFLSINDRVETSQGR
jgi:hypothetical protein